VARLVFSPRANLDLEEIGDYIARDNPARAIWKNCVVIALRFYAHLRRMLRERTSVLEFAWLFMGVI
jgi:hypothetical protein